MDDSSRSSFVFGLIIPHCHDMWRHCTPNPIQKQPNFTTPLSKKAKKFCQLHSEILDFYNFYPPIHPWKSRLGCFSETTDVASAFFSKSWRSVAWSHVGKWWANDGKPWETDANMLENDGKHGKMMETWCLNQETLQDFRGFMVNIPNSDSVGFQWSNFRF